VMFKAAECKSSYSEASSKTLYVQNGGAGKSSRIDYILRLHSARDHTAHQLTKPS